MKKYPLVKIEWVDSSIVAEWHYKEDINFRVKTITSVGYLVKKTKGFHSIAPHITDIDGNDYQCCGLMNIPSCSIKSINEL